MAALNVPSILFKYGLKLSKCDLEREDGSVHSCVIVVSSFDGKRGN